MRPNKPDMMVPTLMTIRSDRRQEALGNKR